MLIWNSNLTRHLVFYLAARVLGNRNGPFKNHPFCHPSHFCARPRGVEGSFGKRSSHRLSYLLIGEKNKALSWSLFLLLMYCFIVTSLFSSQCLVLVESYSSWRIILGTHAHSLRCLPARYPSRFPWLTPILSLSLYLMRLISNLDGNAAGGDLPQMIFPSPFISLSPVSLLSPYLLCPVLQGTVTLANVSWLLLPSMS